MSSLPNTQSVDTNIITDNSETFKGGVEESNITPEKQKELETQEKINWERTLKRRDNVDIEIIKRAANFKNGKKYSTGEIKMLIGTFVEFINIINDKYEQSSYDSNNEQSRESSRNEYTQETSTDRRTDVNPLENSEKINNNEEKGVDNERQIDRRTNQGTNRENSKKLSTTLQMDKTMVSEQSKRLDTNNQGTIRPNRSERTTDNVTIGNERLTKESKISSSDKELIEKEYKN